MYKMNDDYPVEVKVRIMAGQVYAAAELGMWCFDPADRSLYYSTCPNEKEFLAFFKLSGCFDYAFETREGWDRPVILSDSLGLIWVGENIFREGKAFLFILLGPFFINQTSLKHIENELRQKETSIQICREMMRVLSRVPVLHVPMMNQYASMLHYTIMDDRVHPSDFYYQHDFLQTLKNQESDEKAVTEVSSDKMAEGEQRLLQAIRDGNTNYLRILEQVAYSNDVLLSNTGNSVRDGKNTLLVLNALCSRASTEGGVPVKTAREMEMRFAEEIEKCGSISKLIDLNLKMIEEYVVRVRKSRGNPQISKTIQESCDYIRANVQKKLTVEMIAGEIGYTPYYFTKKFNKEMGIRVTDYIKQARIEYAKIALISTSRSIQEISDSLHFGTRNYFSKVFRDIVGITPADYRDRMGREEK
ncbi:MAG: AraC family transcriptional regulator [Lachnospiraceae bacterium]|nr:AraC family transcriptional regulator [Lachnospiraceae bacterium]